MTDVWSPVAEPVAWTTAQAEAAAIAAYTVLLRRPPEQGAVAYWSQELLQGRIDLASMLGSFLRSEEFANKTAAFLQHYGTLERARTNDHSVHEVGWDIQRRLPDYVPSVILDVGANIGQSCIPYAKAWPDATIHAFEPVPSTFGALEQAIATFPQIHAHNVALGAEDGTAVMTGRPMHVGNRIMTGPRSDAPDMISVLRKTGRTVCDDLGIAHVSFLKIDTEGYDLHVLTGFGEMLKEIDFVQVEAAVNPYNRSHVPFRALEDLLRAAGFLLFAIYDQTFEFNRGGRPALRRCNPVFIRGGLVDLRGIS